MSGASDDSSSQTPQSPLRKVNWPHAPPHRLGLKGSYFVTASTYKKQHFFHDASRLDLLQDSLLHHASENGWQLEAWAVFSNHYHFVARPEQDNLAHADLGHAIQSLHRQTATDLNRMDETSERRVWNNYLETHISHLKSLMARLNYTMQNPVRHGLVSVAAQYPWCSAAWFERISTAAWSKTIRNFKTDTLQIPDDF